LLAVPQRGQDQQNRRPGFPRSGQPGDDQPSRPQPAVQGVQVAGIAGGQLCFPGFRQAWERGEPV
jgi:hypothetical protein